MLTCTPGTRSECRYSLQDLVDVRQGRLVPDLQAATVACEGHIKRDCPLCQARGFFCELCDSDRVIFPFDGDVKQCPTCRSAFHTMCVLPACTFASSAAWPQPCPHAACTHRHWVAACSLASVSHAFLIVITHMRKPRRFGPFAVLCCRAWHVGPATPGFSVAPCRCLDAAPHCPKCVRMARRRGSNASTASSSIVSAAQMATGSDCVPSSKNSVDSEER